MKVVFGVQDGGHRHPGWKHLIEIVNNGNWGNLRAPPSSWRWTTTEGRQRVASIFSRYLEQKKMRKRIFFQWFERQCCTAHEVRTAWLWARPWHLTLQEFPAEQGPNSHPSQLPALWPWSVASARGDRLVLPALRPSPGWAAVTLPHTKSQYSPASSDCASPYGRTWMLRFYKSKAGPSTSKEIMTRSIETLAFQRWPGAAPPVSPRCARVF